MRPNHLLTLGSAALLVLSCASGPQFHIPPTSPFAGSSLSHYDALLRHYVVAGDTAALDLIDQEGPKDRLVRLLNRALYLHRLGRYEASNDALQEAEALAEERYTKSITQNLAAFIISDNVLDYTPPAHERAMIHYYGMINYLALGDLDEALVEARKANSYLFRYNRDNAGRRSYSNDAFVQYVAGLLHSSAGDENDALVSLRQADSAFRNYEARYGIYPPRPFGRDLARAAIRVGVPEVAERAIDEFDLTDEELALEGTARRDATGDLLVIVENGFIAHRTEQKLFIPLLKQEKEALFPKESERDSTAEVDREAKRRRRRAEQKAAIEVTGSVLDRTVAEMNRASRERRTYYRQHEDGVIIGSTDVDVDLISFAWPAYDLDAHAVAAVTVEVSGSDAVETALIDDLSAIAARDFEEEKPKILVRMIARGLLKYIAVLKAEDAGEEAGGKVLGFLAKLGATVAATLTERADLRSWSLLPAELRIARFTLPAGTHVVSLSLVDEHGARRVLDLGQVEIRPGRLTIKTAFVTGDYRGAHERFRAARAKVDYELPELSLEAGEEHR